MIRRSLLAATVLVGLAPAGFAADCPAADHNPQLDVVVDDGAIAYDFTRTRQQLTELPRVVGVIAPNHGGAPQGLNLARIKLRISAEVSYRELPGRGLCVYPEHIVLTLSSEQQVFVDQRYPEGSCEFRAVLDHEMEHVRINRAASHAHEAELRTKIARLLAEHRYYLVRSVDRVRQAYLRPINSLATPLLATIRADATHHAELDSPASYAATHAMCQHW